MPRAAVFIIAVIVYKQKILNSYHSSFFKQAYTFIIFIMMFTTYTQWALAWVENDILIMHNTVLCDI